MRLVEVCGLFALNWLLFCKPQPEGLFIFRLPLSNSTGTDGEGKKEEGVFLVCRLV